MRHRIGRHALIAAIACCACGGHARAPIVTLPASPPAAAAARPARALDDCPPARADGAETPWDLPGVSLCVRSERAIATATPDASDADGFRYTLDFADAAGVRWSRPVLAPSAIALRDDGGVVVLDLKQHATLFDASGRTTWSVSFPYCGAIQQVALDADGSVTFGCGYSLLRLGRDGALAWQKWPFGNHVVRGPWVDRRGVLYASGDGRVAALERDGSVRWTFSAGENRAVHGMGWLRGGDMIFVTSMAAMHSDGPVRFYYATVPSELVELSREGKLVSRRVLDGAPRWPTTLPLPIDGAHRAPD